MSVSRSGVTVKSILILLALTQATVNAVEVDVVDPTGKIDPLDKLKMGVSQEVVGAWSNEVYEYFATWLNDPKNGVDLTSKDYLAVDMLFYRAWPASEYKKEANTQYPNFRLDGVERFRKQLAERTGYPQELVPMASLSREEPEYYYKVIKDGQERMKEDIKKGKAPSWFHDHINVKEIFRQAFNYCAHANIAVACQDAADLVNINPPKDEENNWISSIDGSRERAAKAKALLLSKKALLEKSLFSDALKQEEAGQRQAVAYNKNNQSVSKHSMKMAHGGR